MDANATRKVRTARDDRWGFAWEPAQLPDMTVEEARCILQTEEEARALGSFGNEDSSTIEHAKLLVQSAGRA